MSTLSGSQKRAGVRIATTWGTATACGAGHKLVAEITDNANETVLSPRQLGSGNVMKAGVTKGGTSPTVSITGELGFRNNMDVLLAAFFGTAGAPSEQTVGEGDYLHTLTVNSTRNSKYVTAARQSSSGTVVEYPTCAVRSIKIRSTQIPGYAEVQAELLANKIELSSSTNTSSTIADVTLTDTELATCAFEDFFWIGVASGGSLSSSNLLNITQWELTLTQPMRLPAEMKGSAGNGAPIIDGPIEGTLAITLADMADHTYLDAWDAETVYKAKIALTGSTIGAGTDKSVSIYLPNATIINKPGEGLANEGANPVSITFQLTEASSSPTGMSSTMPYIEIVNELSTSLLA